MQLCSFSAALGHTRRAGASPQPLVASRRPRWSMRAARTRPPHGTLCRVWHRACAPRFSLSLPRERRAGPCGRCRSRPASRLTQQLPFSVRSLSSSRNSRSSRTARVMVIYQFTRDAALLALCRVRAQSGRLASISRCLEKTALAHTGSAHETTSLSSVFGTERARLVSVSRCPENATPALAGGVALVMPRSSSLFRSLL
jgi:hypothetical protein